ncbi:exopolysaccharide Pel transporter PelG [Gramella lutea]|uniref:Exopolysaccharide Pel transporter PelG n=1 Tax=Christiangramia lutea TaxID=1607951 RepID=A0A9X1V3B3_9FLAO|nr:exopolysaccharide Pel transporter PelG [Christiangramia lutea]MCH4822906.1 exopolysaccharide Pel transporter PelG [Christiangramia lutea]
MTKEQIKATSKLIVSIKERNGKPVNVYVVAANIESFGIREVDVKPDYGFDSILDLARFVYKAYDAKALANLKNNNQRIAEARNYKRLAISDYITSRNTKRFIFDYASGLVHLFPVAVQIIAIILFGFSLWTFSEFNNLQSTAVVLGVISGFIISAGFVQVIGKQVSYYWYNEDFHMAKYSTIKIIKRGTLTILGFFLLSMLVNFILPLYPALFVVITFSYAILVGFLLLVLAPLYALKQRWMISLSIFLGTVLALTLHWTTDLHPYFIHSSGILLSSLIVITYIYVFFNYKLERNPHVKKKPKVMLSLYRNFNYFLYGFFIFLFVFLDRIVAWSSTLNREIPYIIYYEKDYEIGMDLAIVIFFLLGGVMEYAIHSYIRHMDFHQLEVKYSEYKEFNRKMLNMYYKHLRIFALSAFGIFFLLYLIITKPWGYSSGFEEQLSPLSIKVCVIGGIGYLFFTLGMLNVLYQYTLGKHRRPLLAIIIAFLVNFVIGVLLSRWVSYEYSVVGMLAGSLVFMLLTTRETYHFFKNLDYYYYASY